MLSASLPGLDPGTVSPIVNFGVKGGQGADCGPPRTCPTAGSNAHKHQNPMFSYENEGVHACAQICSSCHASFVMCKRVQLVELGRTICIRDLTTIQSLRYSVEQPQLGAQCQGINTRSQFSPFLEILAQERASQILIVRFHSHDTPLGKF